MVFRIDSDYFFTEVNGYVISAVISTLSLVRVAVFLTTRGARDDKCHLVNSRVPKDRSAFNTNRHLSLYQSTRRNFPGRLEYSGTKCVLCGRNSVVQYFRRVRKIEKSDY